MNELVSIIMPSYNSENYITQSIESVINQTYKYWELIIIDDCSTDNSIEIINQYHEDRIRLLRNSRNLGAALSRNYGLKEAQGRYIAFLDSDDTWERDKLFIQLTFMREHGYAFVYSDYRICMNGKWEKYIRTAPSMINNRRIHQYCYFSTITVLYDVQKVGLIQVPDLKKNNDYAMWIEALSRVDAYRCPKCLANYFKHENSISSVNKFVLIKYHYLMWRDGLKYSKIMSIIYTINNLFFGAFKKLFYRKSIKTG